MKAYLVFMTDLPVASLQGQNPRGGKVENFDDLATAQSLAAEEKNNWDLVCVYKTLNKGGLEKLEQYQNGRKYEVLRNA